MSFRNLTGVKTMILDEDFDATGQDLWEALDLYATLGEKRREETGDEQDAWECAE
jgi:hypothetical protein